MMNKSIPILLAGLALAACNGPTGGADGIEVDTILHNGKIATIDAGLSIQSAVAIRDDRIVAVGGEQLLTEYPPTNRVWPIRAWQHWLRVRLDPSLTRDLDELMRLQASALEQEGSSVRQFLGDGDRQYLSGLYLGGNRILIMVDRSASMLDETLVNIIRTRNMSDEAKSNAPKWQRVVRTVDWISSQLPITSRYQVYSYSDDTEAVLPGTEGQWLEVADRDQLNAIVDEVNTIVPDAGTNMAQMFQTVAQMNPPPDNIFLITDGLPTLGNGRNNDNLVTPRRRLQLFDDAIEELPEGIPVNVILLPLEGDPSASAAYWQLAQYTRGSFVSPARDWP